MNMTKSDDRVKKKKKNSRETTIERLERWSRIRWDRLSVLLSTDRVLSSPSDKMEIWSHDSEPL